MIFWYSRPTCCDLHGLFKDPHCSVPPLTSLWAQLATPPACSQYLQPPVSGDPHVVGPLWSTDTSLVTWWSSTAMWLGASWPAVSQSVLGTLPPKHHDSHLPSIIAPPGYTPTSLTHLRRYPHLYLLPPAYCVYYVYFIHILYFHILYLFLKPLFCISV